MRRRSRLTLRARAIRCAITLLERQVEPGFQMDAPGSSRIGERSGATERSFSWEGIESRRRSWSRPHTIPLGPPQRNHDITSRACRIGNLAFWLKARASIERRFRRHLHSGRFERLQLRISGLERQSIGRAWVEHGPVLGQYLPGASTEAMCQPANSTGYAVRRKMSATWVAAHFPRRTVRTPRALRAVWQSRAATARRPSESHGRSATRSPQTDQPAPSRAHFRLPGSLVPWIFGSI
jgi:hypothetical protein